MLNSKLQKIKDLLIKYGVSTKIVAKSIVLKNKKRIIIPKIKPISPILFIIIAFMADLFAGIRVFQKLINK